MDETRTHDVDAVVVGAGFAGLYMLYRLRNADFTVRVFEAGDSVGGTWYWNRYPGARWRRSRAWEYSYSFSEDLQQEWEWTERYATQPEILRYLNHVADRFDLRPDIQLQTTVVSADYDEGSALWTVGLNDGSTVATRFVIMASGCLSQARVPSFPGLDAYRGRMYHTGDWPAEGVEVSGLRVGIIGNGSSGVQVMPPWSRRRQPRRSSSSGRPTSRCRLATRRSPSRRSRRGESRIQATPRCREQARWSGNGTLRVNYDEPAATAPPELIQQRYETGWAFGGNDIVGSFNDLTTDQMSNDTLAEFLLGKVRQIVCDSQTAQALTAQDYPVGAKRMCLGTDYFETFNRENVTLVDLRSEPIEDFTPDGIRTSAAEYPLDAVIFATGFDAMTGAILRVDIHGRGARSLRDDWAGGPHTYLGLASAGFPNLFFITGPGSPSVLSNVVVSIEQHVEWIGDHIEYLRKRDLTRTEPGLEAQEQWVAHVNDTAGRTLMMKAASWYLGANVPGKPRVFMPYLGGVGNYRRICDEVAADDYRGFVTG